MKKKPSVNELYEYMDTITLEYGAQIDYLYDAVGELTSKIEKLEELLKIKDKTIQLLKKDAELMYRKLTARGLN